MKLEIYKFKQVESTNDIAMNLIKNEEKVTGCVYANAQTKGRGTHGRRWISYKGNLFLSVFFPLKKNYQSFTEFSIINPILISDVIKKFCLKENITLKFPNDLFVNKKKICGILQEILTFNEKKFLIIGIGLNVSSNPNINTKYKTTNIMSETKNKPQIKKILDLIIYSYEKFFSNLSTYKYANFKKKAELMASN